MTMSLMMKKMKKIIIKRTTSSNRTKQKTTLLMSQILCEQPKLPLKKLLSLTNIVTIKTKLMLNPGKIIKHRCQTMTMTKTTMKNKMKVLH